MTRRPPAADAPRHESDWSEALLQCRDLEKSYGSGASEVEVLRSIDLDVTAGVTAVMGPSGSGKSTLLHCLAGLETPNRGQVRYLGENLHARGSSELAKMRRGEFGFIFQTSNLLPFLTVEQNVALPFRLGRRRVPTDRIDRFLRHFGLGHRVGSLPADLSRGEEQRVAIARVFATSPSIVYADEPTAALDLHASRVVVAALHELAATMEGAVLLATHDPMVAAGCAHVVFLVDGKLTGMLEEPSADRVAQVMTNLETSLSDPPCG